MTRILVSTAFAFALLSSGPTSADACGLKLQASQKAQRLRQARSAMGSRTPIAVGPTENRRKQVKDAGRGEDRNPKATGGATTGGATTGPTVARKETRKTPPPPAEPATPASEPASEPADTGGETVAATEPTPREPAETKPARAAGKLHSRVFFANASADLDASSRRKLDANVRWMKANADRSITVEGHSNTTGNADANQALSERRAAAVRDYLVGQGIEESRISVNAYGMDRPEFSPGSSAKNRRVVITPN